MCIPGTALSRYINFYTDFAFKKIFGTEANKDLLISFLNALLELEGNKEIVDLTYLNSERLGKNLSERRAIYDVYCQTKEGERFIVEMQNTKQYSFKDRSIYYSSFAIQEQGEKGSRLSWCYNLSPVYIIGILNFVMDETEESSDKVITKVNLKDEKNRKFSDKLNFIFLEMPKFKKEESELKTSIDKWLFVIKNLCRLQNKPAALTEGIFNKLFEVAEIAAFSKKERYDYEENLKNHLDWFNIMRTAKCEGMAEGRAHGIAEGRAVGIEEGREVGVAIGRAKGEQEEKIRNAKNLKQLGIDIETISKAIGLSKEEIEKL